MKFGIILAALAAIAALSVNFFPKRVRTLSIITLLLITISTLIFLLKDSGLNDEIINLNDEITLLEKYSSVNKLGFKGEYWVQSGSLSLPNGPIFESMRDTWIIVDEKDFRYKCDEDSYIKLKQTIDEFPNYPVSQVALYACNQGDDYALKAMEHLKNIILTGDYLS